MVEGCGGLGLLLLLLLLGALAVEEVGDGVKAEESTAAMHSTDQVVVIPSRNCGESSTKTSDASRRPSSAAEACSSCRRVAPRLSASPICVFFRL